MIEAHVIKPAAVDRARMRARTGSSWALAGNQPMLLAAHREVIMPVRVELQQENAPAKISFSCCGLGRQHGGQRQRVVSETAIVYAIGVGQRNAIGHHGVDQ